MLGSLDDMRDPLEEQDEASWDVRRALPPEEEEARGSDPAAPATALASPSFLAKGDLHPETRTDSVDNPPRASPPCVLGTFHSFPATNAGGGGGSIFHKLSMPDIEDQSIYRLNFFAWLDHGPGQTLDLTDKNVSRRKLESERVRYLTAEELPGYEVVVDKDTGLLKYKVSGRLLHTLPPPSPSEEDATFSGGEGGRGPPPPLPLGSAAGGGGERTTDLPTPLAPPPLPPAKKEKEKKWIWVVAPNGKLYVHAKIRGQFHHSSFLRGSVVMAAGNLIADQGKLTKLTADSGHYWPQPDHFRWFFEHLQGQGADLSALKGIDFSTKH